MIPYSSDMSDDAVHVAYDYDFDDEKIVTKAALLLRKQKLDVQKKDLPENSTLDDLTGGDVLPPSNIDLFQYLILWTKSNEMCRPCHPVRQIIL